MSNLRQRLRSALSAFRRDRRGNVAVLSALMLPVLLGSFGLGTEVATWYGNQRALQNAADSAALAAATNASASYATEARAVAARYGYVNGVGGVAITALNGQPCPSGGNTCYSVTITRTLPLMFSPLVGYQGDTAVGGSRAKRISATAVATLGNAPRPYCLVALGSGGVQTALLSNGAPFANLAGCNVMSNTNARCNGHDLGADHGDAAGTNDGCGEVQTSSVPVMTDPYLHLAADIPANTCSSYGGSTLTGSVSWSGVVQKCGTVRLTGPVTVDAPDDAVLVIQNGDLDTNGYTLQTTSGSGLTVIFAGSNSYSHIPTGGGTLDFAAPTSGTWSGVAMMQAPNLTSGVDISDAGNDPTWKISGLVYLPKSDVLFSGAVNKASNGASCFAMVVNSLRINGTGSILARGECAQAGLAMPTNNVPSRGRLVS